MKTTEAKPMVPRDPVPQKDPPDRTGWRFVCPPGRMFARWMPPEKETADDGK